MRNALKDFTETEVEEIARYLDFKDKAMMGRAKEKDKDAQGNKSDEEESYDSEKSIEEIPLAQVQAMIRVKKTSTPSPHSRRISLGETRTKKVSMSPTMEKRKTRATSMAERAAAEASKAEKATVPQRKSERLVKEAPRRKATAAKSFEHTKDPGRGQRKDADVQTPAKRKAKTTESSVSGFKRLRKLGGIPTTSGTPSKEYNEVEVRNEITEKMVDGNVQSVGISEPARNISSTDGEGIIGEGHSQVPHVEQGEN